jgi:hypothetical protein
VFGDGIVTAFRLSKRSPMLHTIISRGKEEKGGMVIGSSQRKCD